MFVDGGGRSSVNEFGIAGPSKIASCVYPDDQTALRRSRYPRHRSPTRPTDGRRTARTSRTRADFKPLATASADAPTPQRHTGLRPWMHEDRLDDWLHQDSGDDLQLAAAVLAVHQVDLEGSPGGSGSTQRNRAPCHTLPHWLIRRRTVQPEANSPASSNAPLPGSGTAPAVAVSSTPDPLVKLTSGGSSRRRCAELP